MHMHDIGFVNSMIPLNGKIYLIGRDLLATFDPELNKIEKVEQLR